MMATVFDAAHPIVSGGVWHAVIATRIVGQLEFPHLGADAVEYTTACGAGPFYGHAPYGKIPDGDNHPYTCMHCSYYLEYPR